MVSKLYFGGSGYSILLPSLFHNYYINFHQLYNRYYVEWDIFKILKSWTAQKVCARLLIEAWNFAFDKFLAFYPCRCYLQLSKSWLLNRKSWIDVRENFSPNVRQKLIIGNFLYYIELDVCYCRIFLHYLKALNSPSWMSYLASKKYFKSLISVLLCYLGGLVLFVWFLI